MGEAGKSSFSFYYLFGGWKNLAKICPLCNGLESIHVSCKRCGSLVKDGGRYMDFFDDYSAYLDIDELKKTDGIENDYAEQKCPHLLFCYNCNKHFIFLISEV